MDLYAFAAYAVVWGGLLLIVLMTPMVTPDRVERAPACERYAVTDSRWEPCAEQPDAEVIQ